MDTPLVQESLSRSCKVGRCYEVGSNGRSCGACRRCGCDHDGLRVSGKKRRKRGQRGISRSNAVKPAERSTVSSLNSTTPSSPCVRKNLASAFVCDQSSLPDDEVHSISDMLRAFGLKDKTAYYYKHLPSLSQRKDPRFWEEHASSRSHVFGCTLVKRLLKQICLILCGDYNGAANVLLNIVSGSGSDIFSKNIALFSSYMENMATWYKNATKSSVEKRVLGACIAQLPRRRLSTLCDAVPDFTMASKSYARARQDIVALADGQQVQRKIRSLCNFNVSDVNDAVSFIFSPDNISYLSWGTKRLRLHGKLVVLPAIMRKKSRTHIYEDFVASATRSSPPKDPISRSSFIRIVSSLTAGDSKMRKAVDYVVGLLINDPFDNLVRVVGSLPIGYNDRQQLTKDMEVIRAYLKYGFDERVKNQAFGLCCLHDIEFGLDATASRDLQFMSSLCGDCQAVFDFYGRLER